MKRGSLTRVLDDLQRTLEAPDEPDSDRRLLERFIGHGDAQAFTALLRRHSAMVHGVCRRVLGNVDDAEDVFQATFLVLLRKARSVRRTASLGSWLYGVAHRTALEARRAMARRRAKEALVPARATPSGNPQLDELRDVLDLELARLPERYRQVIVLCDLEGQTRRAVAERLGCPDGTVASRLAKARALLAARLTRHGLTLSAAALTTALAGEAASAGAPAAWLTSTLSAARHLAAPAAATAGAVSTRVATLVQGVCKTMLVKKLTTLGAMLFLVVLLGCGAGTWYVQTVAAGPPVDEQDGAPPAPGKPADARAEVLRLKEGLQLLRGKTAALEARLAELERDRPDVLFRGKPASFWMKAVQDRDPKYRQDAVIALAGIAEVDHRLIPTVAASLRDTDDEVRETASVQLANRIGAPALPLLIAALKDPLQLNRNWAANTIGRYPESVPQAVPALTALLQSRNLADRIVAAGTLGRLGRDAASAVPFLMYLLKHRSTVEASIAARALASIGPNAREAVPLLIDLLPDHTPHVIGFDQSLQPVFGGRHEYSPRIEATLALGEIGPDARAALPALRALKDERIQDVVRDAIRKIDPDAVEKK